MDDATFASLHWAKIKRCARGPHALRGMNRHRAKFCFTACAKTFHVTDDALIFFERSSQSLIEEVLECVEKFAPLIQKQRCISAGDIQETP